MIDYDTWLLVGMEEYYGVDGDEDEGEPEEPDFEDPPLSRYD